jgi:hypothetical protein
MHVDIKGRAQVAPPLPGGRENSVSQGHLKVAHYEAVGKGVKDSSVPERDDRSLSPWLTHGLAKQPIDRPLRDGALLKKRDPPLRIGLLSNDPFLLRPAVASLWRGLGIAGAP